VVILFYQITVECVSSFRYLAYISKVSQNSSAHSTKTKQDFLRRIFGKIGQNASEVMFELIKSKCLQFSCMVLKFVRRIQLIGIHCSL